MTTDTFASALESTKCWWQAQNAAVFAACDPDLTAWMRWVGIQPTLRRICGCSFLPHHDYGRGGRGWRDLWQDSLALLLHDPAAVRGDLVRYFAGVRADGTNATIIGRKPGEFVADRNRIVRVWMDHGLLAAGHDRSVHSADRRYFDFAGKSALFLRRPQMPRRAPERYPRPRRRAARCWSI